VSIFIGIDVGTSACRACAIDAQGNTLAETRTALPPAERSNGGAQQDARCWWDALCATLDSLLQLIDRQQLCRIAVDGTSATLLLCDLDGRPLTPGLMYNDARAELQAQQVAALAPADCAARGSSSSLAKLLYLQDSIGQQPFLALHQADWLTARLCNRYRFSDENNALKLGYDPLRRRWPEWIAGLGVSAAQLPEVVAPGTRLGRLHAVLARRWQLPATTEILAGTTDSTAGFIAAGAQRNGSAVTSLGSTLVMKVLAEHPVSSARHGVYSHRLAGRWILGGASNAGGSVLRQLFSAEEIQHLSQLLQPDQPTGLDYYPLPAPGERFPVADPGLLPRLEPRPAADAVFFQGILEGLAQIEQQAYRLLEQLGAPYPGQVLTVGGGALNTGWQRIRERLLGVPVRAAEHQQAAYGTALLALRGESVFTHP
jgi:sugar (pentulose or hexulose) kinase